MGHCGIAGAGCLTNTANGVATPAESGRSRLGSATESTSVVHGARVQLKSVRRRGRRRITICMARERSPGGNLPMRRDATLRAQPLLTLGTLPDSRLLYVFG